MMRAAGHAAHRVTKPVKQTRHGQATDQGQNAPAILPESPAMPARIDAVSMLQGLALGLLFTTAAARISATRARAATGGLSLFRVVTMRGDMLIGLPRQDIPGSGTGPEADRLAGRIAAEGELTAWRYVVRRGADGTTRLVARDRVCLLRQDVLMLEPHAPAIPVLPPPGP